jgi:hypothetical protein
MNPQIDTAWSDRTPGVFEHFLPFLLLYPVDVHPVPYFFGIEKQLQALPNH